MSQVLQARQVGGRCDPPVWFPLKDQIQPSRMSDLLQMMGIDVDAHATEVDTPMPIRRLRAGDTLFHQGLPAQAVYFVRAGTFKVLRTAEDGYEQVLGFSGRGDILGFDAVARGLHPSEAVALEDSSAYVVLLADLLALGQDEPGLVVAVHHAVSRALAGRGDLADVMAAVAAEVRLARFLIQMSQRMASFGQSPRRLRLRMSRRDIGSYLGVAHETVSRSFRALAEAGLLEVSNREVEIRNLEGLKDFARNTRRQVDDGSATCAPPPKVAAARATARLS